MSGKIHAPLVRAKYEQIIEPVRHAARALGYAIGVHGSIARDIDLIAVPWREHAVEPKALAEAVRRVVIDLGDWRAQTHDLLAATLQPHGRRSYTIPMDCGTYIDLSVMPLAPPPAASREEGP